MMQQFRLWRVCDAPPSYRAACADRPPVYVEADGFEMPARPASAHTTYASGPNLEAALSPVMAPAPNQAPRAATTASISSASAVLLLGGLVGASLVALAVPALPGIIMLTVGHAQQRAILQHVGTGWVACSSAAVIYGWNRYKPSRPA